MTSSSWAGGIVTVRLWFLWLLNEKISIWERCHGHANAEPHLPPPPTTGVSIGCYELQHVWINQISPGDLSHPRNGCDCLWLFSFPLSPYSKHFMARGYLTHIEYTVVRVVNKHLLMSGNPQILAWLLKFIYVGLKKKEIISVEITIIIMMSTIISVCCVIYIYIYNIYICSCFVI